MNRGHGVKPDSGRVDTHIARGMLTRRRRQTVGHPGETKVSRIPGRGESRPWPRADWAGPRPGRSANRGDECTHASADPTGTPAVRRVPSIASVKTGSRDAAPRGGLRLFPVEKPTPCPLTPKGRGRPALDFPRRPGSTPARVTPGLGRVAAEPGPALRRKTACESASDRRHLEAN